jgi:hypothetical protein
MMNMNKNLIDQDFTEEEKRWVEDWLARIADGRIVVNFYRGTNRPKAFGVDIGAQCDKEKVRLLCEEVRQKPATIIITPDERIIRIP